MSNPYLTPTSRSRNARRGALGALNFPMIDPQVMAMLQQMQAGAPQMGATQPAAMPQFGAAVAPMGGAVTQPTMMDGAMGPQGPTFQQTAMRGETVRGPGMGAPSMAPTSTPSPPVRQPQPGEGAPSQRRGPGRIELFDIKPDTLPDPVSTDLSDLETPIAPVKEVGPQTLRDRIANFGQRAITPNEKTGISAVDGLIAAAQMIQAGEPTWDLSPQNHGMAGVANALGGLVETGRERVRQKKADDRDEARFNWENRDQEFRGAEQVRARDIWKSDDERKRHIANAIMNPASGFTQTERDALLAATPDQQAEILLKKGLIGPGLRTVQDGRYVTTDWRGNQTEGDMTPGGQQAQANFNKQIGAQYARARDAGRPEGVSPFYVKPNARDQADFQRYAQEAENGQEASRTLHRIRDTVVQLGQDEFGQPLSAASRMKISQIAGQNARARGLHQQLNADTWNIVLENLKGLAPVSEAEIKLAMERTVSGEWTQEQALRYIDNLIEKTDRMVERGYTAMDFVNNAGSYASGKDAQGRTWTDIQRERYANLDRPAAPAAPDAAALPPVNQRKVGERYRMGDGTEAYWTGFGFSKTPPNRGGVSGFRNTMPGQPGGYSGR